MWILADYINPNPDAYFEALQLNVLVLNLRSWLQYKIQSNSTTNNNNNGIAKNSQDFSACKLKNQ